MKLRLERRIFTDDVTIGDLYVNDELLCYVLEDAVRPEKIYGKTAIPKGTYKVQLTMSNRFKKILPLLIDVPNYEGVRIHTGNTNEDTDGCLIVGTTIIRDMRQNIDWMVGESRVAMARLMVLLRNQPDIEITICNKNDDPGK